MQKQNPTCSQSNLKDGERIWLETYWIPNFSFFLVAPTSFSLQREVLEKKGRFAQRAKPRKLVYRSPPAIADIQN